MYDFFDWMINFRFFYLFLVIECLVIYVYNGKEKVCVFIICSLLCIVYFVKFYCLYV